MNFAPFGVASQTGGKVTIVNTGGAPKGFVANHTGGTAIIIENGKKTTTVKPSSSGTAAATTPPATRAAPTVINYAPDGVEEVKDGETVVINNRS